MNIKNILLVFLFTSVVSCKNTGNKKDIGFLFDTFEVERWKKDRDYFLEKVKELGYSAIVRSANGDEAAQFKLAKELINYGVKVLVIVPVNSNSAAAIVRLAHKNNVKVIAYDRLINNCNLDYFLSFDSEQTGVLKANYFLKIKPQGNYVIINGDPSDISAVKEHQGIINILKPKIKNGDINIVYDTYIEGWSPEDAKYIMKKIIEFSDVNIDAIIAGNDGMIDGIYETLKEYNLNKKILLAGLDAEPQALKRILNSDQTITIYTSLKKLAYAAATLSIDLLKNKKIDNENFTKVYNNKVFVPSLILSPEIVDKNNIETTVIADGFISRNEIENTNY